VGNPWKMTGPRIELVGRGYAGVGPGPAVTTSNPAPYRQ
jgi:hypothetical protein